MFPALLFGNPCHQERKMENRCVAGSFAGRYRNAGSRQRLRSRHLRPASGDQVFPVLCLGHIGHEIPPKVRGADEERNCESSTGAGVLCDAVSDDLRFSTCHTPLSTRHSIALLCHLCHRLVLRLPRKRFPTRNQIELAYQSYWAKLVGHLSDTLFLPAQIPASAGMVRRAEYDYRKHLFDALYCDNNSTLPAVHQVFVQ